MTTTRYGGDTTEDPRSPANRSGPSISEFTTWLVGEDDPPKTASLSAEVARLAEEFDVMQSEVRGQPSSWSIPIIDLGEPGYRLVQPLPVLVQEYPEDGGAIARCPELELFGDGNTSAEALANLKSAILDLYDELTGCDIDTLGGPPQTWLRILRQVIVREQE